ncbi:hypothetical protein WP8W19C02_28150 [Enterobacter cloacae]|nr:hypothetical protein DEM28_07420 [Enterobacter mori]BBT91195.1 hypothetical protein WP8W19C02_28150 [Enterobacter cloacae]
MSDTVLFRNFTTISSEVNDATLHRFVHCTDTDNDDILIEQSVLEWMYQECQQDEKQAAVKALTFLMVQVAKQGDEQVGGVTLKNS